MVWAHSKKYHINYCVPTKVIAPHIPGKDAYRFPGINYLADPWELQEYKEKGFRYENIPPVDNVCFVGYWQSWKYFDEYRNELLSALGLPYKKRDGVVALQIRRGDFLQMPNHHPPVTKEYIEKAIYFFRKTGFIKFWCCSDDIDWCKENILVKGVDIEFSENKDELQDLIDGSCCEHQITSNSTFGWWQFYLNQNKNKIGVMPKTWFGPALNHDTQDLFLPNTILM